MRHNSHLQVRLARQVLDKRFATPITIDDLSREVALSPYYLIRKFRHLYRLTPYQYLLSLRIAAAKQLLRDTDLSVTEICAAVGFESLGSFSTLFSRLAGVSPRAYRSRSQPTVAPHYIPACIRKRHGLDDQTEN